MDDKQRNMIFKIVELILAILCAALFCAAYEKRGYSTVGREMAEYVGMTAFLWIIGIMLISLFMDKYPHYYVNIMVCLVCAVFFLAGGACLIDDYSEGMKSKVRDLALSAGSIGIITCIVFVADIVMDVLANK